VGGTGFGTFQITISKIEPSGLMFLIAVILWAAMLAIMPTPDFDVNYANTCLQMLFIYRGLSIQWLAA
jgi:hypothetical protein